MLELGAYQLNRNMIMVDVEKGKMFNIPLGDTINVTEPLGGGKCLVNSAMGDFVAMEHTIKALYLDGWLTRLKNQRAQVA